MMKRTFYIFLFVIFGLLLQFLVHALFEMGVLSLLLADFERYNLGLSWNQWYAVHQMLSFVLVIFGVVLGYRGGVYWWQVIYVEHRYKQWKWWPKKPSSLPRV